MILIHITVEKVLMRWRLNSTPVCTDVFGIERTPVRVQDSVSLKGNERTPCRDEMNGELTVLLS